MLVLANIRAMRVPGYGGSSGNSERNCAEGGTTLRTRQSTSYPPAPPTRWGACLAASVPGKTDRCNGSRYMLQFLQRCITWSYKMLKFSPFFDHARFEGHMRNWRRQHKLSYRDMAKITGYSHSSLSRLEKGEQTPDIGFFLVLCRIMNLEPWNYFQTTENIETLREDMLPKF